MAKKLTAHQKALRKEYARELKNARARMKRLEKSGYVFDFELARAQKPTKRDIQRVKNITSKRLAKAGTQIDKWSGEIISTPSKAAKTRLGKTIQYKPLPETQAVAPQPVAQLPEQEQEPEYFKGDFPVWNELLLQRLLGRAANFAQYRDPEISEHGKILIEFLQSKIREYGESNVANVLSDVLESAPDLFEDTAFYSSQIFNHTMDMLFNAFQSANMMNRDEITNMQEKFENFNELFEGFKDYDNDEE